MATQHAQDHGRTLISHTTVGPLAANSSTLWCFRSTSGSRLRVLMIADRSPSKSTRAMLVGGCRQLHADSQLAQLGWLGLTVGGRLTVSLHSSHEPSELAQWPCHDIAINFAFGINVTHKF